MRHPSTLALIVLLAASCGGGGGTDAGHDAAHAPCTTDHDCDDGMYCNGPSVCVVGIGCVAGTPPCAAGQLCSEASHTCTTDCSVTRDADSDGHVAMLCGGDDCDDSDPHAYPGNVEICDPANHDEDCDPATFGFRDADGDGYPDARCCNGTHCGTDCSDENANVHPTQAEVCNGVDDDCNGLVDDGITLTWTVDADGDGHGDATPGATTMTGCTMPHGYASVADDCDDHDAARHPGLAEICDGIDDDCDGMVDNVGGAGCMCLVGQIQDCGLVGRCMGATQSCMGTTWGPCSIMPIVETCNGIDDDCNGTVDDGLTTTCYSDMDGDGYAPVGGPSQRCIDTSRMASPYDGCPAGYTGRAPAGAVDCCDLDANAHPTQTMAFMSADACGNFDYNCDGMQTSDAIWLQTDSCTSQTAVTTCNMAHAGWVGTPPACGGGASMGFYGDCYWDGTRCYDSSIGTGAARPCL